MVDPAQVEKEWERWRFSCQLSSFRLQQILLVAVQVFEYCCCLYSFLGALTSKSGDVCRPRSESAGEFRASRSDPAHADCLITLAILRAKLCVARKLLPKKRTFPCTVRSRTILPSRVMS
jgi:hypothetical protein